MSSSSIQLPVFQAKIGSIQNQADSSSVYSAGEWSFKNASAVTSVKIDNSGNVGIGTASPGHALDIQRPEANLRLSSTTLTNNAFTYYVNNGGTALIGLDNAVGTYGSPYALHINYQAAYPIIFSTNYVNRMIIDPSGNVGIGGNPTGSFDILRNTASVGAADYPNIRLNNANTTGYSGLYFYQGGTQKAGFEVKNDVGALTFMTNSAERMRIDAAGSLIVGPTLGYGGLSLAKTGSLSPGVFLWINATATTQKFASFEYNGNGGSGSITPNGTGNVAFNTGPSDYRLKDEVVELSGGLEKIKSLRPVAFKWKKSGETDVGFIAHEIQQVIPQCVNGDKDAVDEEGNPSYQSIFPAPAQMIATLVAAIQEQQAQIEVLKAEVAALKAP